MGRLDEKIKRALEYMMKKRLDIFVLTKALIDRAEKKRHFHQMVSKYGHLYLNGETKEGLRKKTTDTSQTSGSPVHAQGGVAIIVTNRVHKYIKGIPLINPDKRTISIDFNFPNVGFTLVGCYSPPDKEENNQFWIS